MSGVNLRLVGPDGMGDKIGDDKVFSGGTRAMFVVVDADSTGTFVNQQLEVTFEILRGNGPTQEAYELPYINTDASGNHFFSCIWERFSRISLGLVTTIPSMSMTHSLTQTETASSQSPTQTETASSQSTNFVPQSMKPAELMWRMSWSNTMSDFISGAGFTSKTVSIGAYGTARDSTDPWPATELTNYTPTLDDLFDIVAIDGTFGKPPDSSQWTNYPYRADGPDGILRGNILKWKTDAHQAIWAPQIKYLTFNGGLDGNETHLVNLEGMTHLESVSISGAEWFKKIQNFSSAGSLGPGLSVDFTGTFTHCTGNDCSNNYDVLPDISNQYDETLPFDVWPTKMTSLNLSGCSSVEKLTGLPDTLEELNVSYTGIENVTDLGITNNNKSNIIVLDMYGLCNHRPSDHSSMLAITGDYLSGFTSLERLDIARVKSSAPKITFTPNSLPTSLITLNIRCQDIASLPALPSSLEILYADGNELTTIPALPVTLRELSLGSYIPFFGVVGNPLTSWTSVEITGGTTLPNLTTLLADASTEFKITDLTMMVALVKLQLSNSTLSGNTLPNTPNTLKTLTASQSNLESVYTDDDNFGISTSPLTSLNLGTNQSLSISPAHIAAATSTLEMLDLSYCGITSLDLSSFTKLDDISLNNNLSIDPEEIKLSAQGDLEYRELNLRNCNLTTIPDMSGWYITELDIGGTNTFFGQSGWSAKLPVGLERLTISSVDSLVTLASEDMKSTAINYLNMSYCQNLTRIAEGKLPTGLQTLAILECPSFVGGTTLNEINLNNNCNDLYWISILGSGIINKLTMGTKTSLEHIYVTDYSNWTGSTWDGFQFRGIVTEKTSRVAGHISSFTGNLPALRTLVMDNCELISIDLSTSSGLELLYMVGNKLTSVNLPGSLENLRQLYVSGNKMTNIPTIPNDAKSLTHIYLDDNLITSQTHITTLLQKLVDITPDNPGHLVYSGNIDRKIPDTDANFKTLTQSGWRIRFNTPTADAFESIGDGTLTIPDSTTWGPRQIYIKFPATGGASKILVGDKTADISGYPTTFKIKDTVWESSEVGVNKKVRMGGFVFIRVTWHGYVTTSGSTSIQDADEVEILVEVTELGQDDPPTTTTETIPASQSESESPILTNTTSTSITQSTTTSDGEVDYGVLPTEVYISDPGNNGFVSADAHGKYTLQPDTTNECPFMGMTVGLPGRYYKNANDHVIIYDVEFTRWYTCSTAVYSNTIGVGGLIGGDEVWSYFSISLDEAEQPVYPSKVFVLVTDTTGMINSAAGGWYTKQTAVDQQPTTYINDEVSDWSIKIEPSILSIALKNLDIAMTYSTGLYLLKSQNAYWPDDTIEVYENEVIIPSTDTSTTQPTQTESDNQPTTTVEPPVEFSSVIMLNNIENLSGDSVASELQLRISGLKPLPNNYSTKLKNSIDAGGYVVVEWMFVRTGWEDRWEDIHSLIQASWNYESDSLDDFYGATSSLQLNYDQECVWDLSLNNLNDYETSANGINLWCASLGQAYAYEPPTGFTVWSSSPYQLMVRVYSYDGNYTELGTWSWDMDLSIPIVETDTQTQNPVTFTESTFGKSTSDLCVSNPNDQSTSHPYKYTGQYSRITTSNERGVWQKNGNENNSTYEIQSTGVYWYIYNTANPGATILNAIPDNSEYPWDTDWNEHSISISENDCPDNPIPSMSTTTTSSDTDSVSYVECTGDFCLDYDWISLEGAGPDYRGKFTLGGGDLGSDYYFGRPSWNNGSIICYWRPTGGTEGEWIFGTSSAESKWVSFSTSQCPWNVNWDTTVDGFDVAHGACPENLLTNGDFSYVDEEGDGHVPSDWTKEGSALIASDFVQDDYMDSGIIKRIRDDNPGNLRLRQGFSALEKNTQYTLTLGNLNTNKKFKIRFRRVDGSSCKVLWNTIDGVDQPDQTITAETATEKEVTNSAIFTTKNNNNYHVVEFIDVGISQQYHKLNSVFLKKTS